LFDRVFDENVSQCEWATYFELFELYGCIVPKRLHSKVCAENSVQVKLL
jgi:hypothetical protein